MKSRHGYKRSIVATAHKMFRINHVVLRDGKPYTDLGIDYEKISINRKASRWPKELGQYGHIVRLEDGISPETPERHA